MLVQTNEIWRNTYTQSWTPSLTTFTYRWRFVGFLSHFLRTANKFSTVRCTSKSQGPNCGFSFWILKNFDYFCVWKTIYRNMQIKCVTLLQWFLKWSKQLRNGSDFESLIKNGRRKNTLTLTQSTVLSFIEPVGRLGIDGTGAALGLSSSFAFFP